MKEISSNLLNQIQKYSRVQYISAITFKNNRHIKTKRKLNILNILSFLIQTAQWTSIWSKKNKKNQTSQIH